MTNKKISHYTLEEFFNDAPFYRKKGSVFGLTRCPNGTPERYTYQFNDHTGTRQSVGPKTLVRLYEEVPRGSGQYRSTTYGQARDVVDRAVIITFPDGRQRQFEKHSTLLLKPDGMVWFYASELFKDDFAPTARATNLTQNSVAAAPLAIA